MASIAFGALLVVFGTVLFFVARKAQLRQGIIPAAGRFSWMTPEQGYAAAGLAVLVGGFLIVSAVREWLRK